MKRHTWLGVMTILLVACGGREESAPAEETVTEVGVIEIAPQEIVDWAVLPADLIADRKATLAAEVPGRVEQMRVEVGDQLTRGMTIASVDRRVFAQQVAEAEAYQRQAAEDAQRAEKLFEKRSITRQRLTAAQTGLNVADARLASARLTLDKSTLRAPWSGRVSGRWAEAGDYLQPGQPVVELVSDRKLKVRAPVAAPDAPLIKLGMPVEVTVEGFGTEIFRGEIVRVGATLDIASRTLQLEAEIDNSEGRLKAGMYGQLRFPRRKFEQAVAVPLGSLIDTETGKLLYLVDSDGVVRRVDPELGSIIGDQVILLNGVVAGDRVVVEGQYRISDGMNVELRVIER